MEVRNMEITREIAQKTTIVKQGLYHPSYFKEYPATFTANKNYFGKVRDSVTIDFVDDGETKTLKSDDLFMRQMMEG